MQNIDLGIMVKVLESNKQDINVWDILSDFDEDTEEETIKFIEDNKEEFEIFLNTTLHHIMNRIKIRVSFATCEKDI